MNSTLLNIINAEAGAAQDEILTTMTIEEKSEYDKLVDKASGIWDHFRKSLNNEEFKLLLSLETMEAKKESICEMHMFRQGAIKGIKSGLTMV
jgi:hypothetical protein